MRGRTARDIEFILAFYHASEHLLEFAKVLWREPGTTAVCQLRALYKSEYKLWQNYWNRAMVP